MSDQRTAEWFAERCGKVTASRVADVMDFKRDGSSSAARDAYLAEIVAERLSGETYEHFVSKPMQWGIDVEPEARGAYEAIERTFVDLVGFVPHPMIANAGASPDGMVGADGLIEIKCPNTSTHIKTLIRGTGDPQYTDQIQWQLACTGRDWCDFVSFDPRIPAPMSLFIARVKRSDERIAELHRGVVRFLAEVDEIIERLQETYA